MQALIEEYETSQEEMRASNEELQSANEELRSTMEELETSKEELHSMNEEVHTVNQENRHKVEELAQLSGDLQNLLSATDIATLFLDRDLRILRFTPSVAELFNVRITDRGRPLSDLTHRLGYDELLEDATSVLQKLVSVERELSDDQGHWYLTRLLPYRSLEERIEGVVITFVDVTAKREANEALRRSEERVSLELTAMVRLHDLVSQLLVCPDLTSALEEVLDATMSITGAAMGYVQLPDSTGKRLEVASQRGLAPALAKQLASLEDDVTSACHRAWRSATRIIIEDVELDPSHAIRPDARMGTGDYRSLQATPLVSRGGEVLGVLSTHYPEPYRPSEWDLRILDLYARQAADFIERTQSRESLRETIRRLQNEDEQKDLFIATLGHELRSPLAALDNAMQLIETGAKTDATLQPMISAQVALLKRVVNDLLEISRITHGKVTLHMNPTDLVEVIRRAVECVASSAREKRQRLVLPSIGGLVIRADAIRLEQVVSNLLSNASKYSPEGSTITVELEGEGSEAVLRVRDEGLGIDPRERERIFEPFMQSEPGSGGLGIGLPLVKRLVELHGGSVEVQSEGPGRGSTFTVRLPIGPRAQGSDSSDDSSEGGNRDTLPASIRVLVVDDNQEYADSLALLLETRGAHVRCAYDGGRALEIARKWSPQVLLVDIGLPDMPGHVVARKVRELPAGAEALLVAVTGFGDRGTLEEALRSGFDESLVKPMDHEQLEALICRHQESPRR